MPNEPSALKVEEIVLVDILPPLRQTRLHTVRKIKTLAASIADTGFFSPVLIDEDLRLIAGYARIEAAKRLGMRSVPAFVLRGLSSFQKRRLALADNKLPEQATWDSDTLAEELRELLEADYENLGLTGFESPDIDFLISPKPLSLEDEEANVPEPSPFAVSLHGDKWLCGNHVVVCGDARDEAAYQLALEGARADVVFADPPYGISIANDISQKGAVKHEDFAMASGEMNDGELSSFFGETLARMKTASRDGAVAFVCIDWRHFALLERAAATSFGKLINLCVWTKTNPGLGSFYRSQHELVLVLRNGNAPHTNTIPLGSKRRYRTNVWTYAGNTANISSRKGDLASHPTVKPTAMIADALEDVSAPGQLVLDPFGGSGATMIAANSVKRRAALIEIEPKFVDVSLTRFQKATGVEPVLATTGETFSQVRSRRQGETNEKFPEWPPAQRQQQPWL